MEEVNNQNLWTFELGSQKNKNVNIWLIIGFQQNALQDSQKLNIDTLVGCLLRVLKVFIGTENYIQMLEYY